MRGRPSNDSKIVKEDSELEEVLDALIDDEEGDLFEDDNEDEVPELDLGSNWDMLEDSEDFYE